jgi:hypothetical protein
LTPAQTMSYTKEIDSGSSQKRQVISLPSPSATLPQTVGFEGSAVGSEGKSAMTTQQQMLHTIQVLRADFKDAAERASVLSAENIMLKEEVERLQNLLVTNNIIDGKIENGASKERIKHLEQQLENIKVEYKKEMEENILYQQRMLGEIDSLTKRNEALHKEKEAGGGEEGAGNGTVDGKGPLLSASSLSTGGSSMVRLADGEELYGLRRQLAYANAKLKSRVSKDSQSYESEIRRKNTLIESLTKQFESLEAQYTEAMTELESRRVTIWNQLATLLANTGRRSRVREEAETRQRILEAAESAMAKAEGGTATNELLTESFKIKEDMFLKEIKDLKDSVEALGAQVHQYEDAGSVGRARNTAIPATGDGPGSPAPDGRVEELTSAFKSKEELYKKEIKDLCSTIETLTSERHKTQQEQILAAVNDDHKGEVSPSKGLVESFKAKEEIYVAEIQQLKIWNTTLETLNADLKAASQTDHRPKRAATRDVHHGSTPPNRSPSNEEERTVLPEETEAKYKEEIRQLKATIKSLELGKETHWAQMHAENEALEHELHVAKEELENVQLQLTELKYDRDDLGDEEAYFERGVKDHGKNEGNIHHEEIESSDDSDFEYAHG